MDDLERVSVGIEDIGGVVSRVVFESRTRGDVVFGASGDGSRVELIDFFAEVPPRVEYELTALGRSLLVPMQGLVDWVTENWERVKESRVEFDAR